MTTKCCSFMTWFVSDFRKKKKPTEKSGTVKTLKETHGGSFLVSLSPVPCRVMSGPRQPVTCPLCAKHIPVQGRSDGLNLFGNLQVSGSAATPWEPHFWPENSYVILCDQPRINCCSIKLGSYPSFMVVVSRKCSQVLAQGSCETFWTSHFLIYKWSSPPWTSNVKWSSAVGKYVIH